MLRQEGTPVEARSGIVDAVAAGQRPPALSAREAALLAYAEKLTSRPAAIEASDVEALRAVGLDDLAIHDACAVVGYFAFVNRIADGLGVELESPG